MPRSARNRPAKVVDSPEATTEEEGEPEYRDEEVPIAPVSDSDDEEAQPSRSRLKGKRRASAVFGDASNSTVRALNASASSSFDTNTPSRPDALRKRPSTFLEVDRDAVRAEKRQRRKSTRQSFVAPANDDGAAGVAGPSGTGGGESSPDRSGAAARPGMRTPRMSGRINVVPPLAPAPVVSMDVMSSNFEEWMKMATDNVGYVFLYHPLAIAYV